MNYIIYSKISELVEGPAGNMDSMQIFRYSEADEHKTQHEYFSSYVSAHWGARAVAVKMFLSDVEEGGDTVFDQLNIRKLNWLLL